MKTSQLSNRDLDNIFLWFTVRLWNQDKEKFALKERMTAHKLDRIRKELKKRKANQ